MSDKIPDGEHRDDTDDSATFIGRSRRFFSLVRVFDSREQYWRLLDAWEENRRFRWTFYGVLAGVLMVVATWVWVNPWWSERTSIAMARQWLLSGRLDRAGESVQQALSVAPGNPVAWQLASELAKLRGNSAVAMNYAHYAAEVSKWDPAYVLQWASIALQADKPEEVQKALAALPSGFVESSSLAQRILGEMSRRRGELSQAQNHFETALKLDGPLAIDEVPLGIVLITSNKPGSREQGIALLAKWVNEPELGAAALRSLLADALLKQNTPDMLKWSLALRSHPRCTLSDIPNCLLALSLADTKSFKVVLADLEKAHSSEANLAGTLISWLNQIGRSAEALDWARTLPTSMTSKPSVAISISEAMRETKNWRELQEWTQRYDLGSDLQFMFWSYGMLAAKELGQTERQQELWSSLKAHSEANGAHALFAASTIYTWGLREEAIALFKIASEVPGAEVQALGSLARHYQVTRDAMGQYDVFRRLYSLRSHDTAISNNYAFFAALTGKDLATAERLSRDNFEHFPDNLTFRATFAFVLGMRGSYAEAHKLLRPVEKEWKRSSALAFAYGFILAKTNNKTEARTILATLKPEELSKMEVNLLVESVK